LLNPKAGNVIRGSGGLRKLRIAFQGKGKSGSGRVAYVDFTIFETIYLVTAYSKNEKDNFTNRERNEIAKLIAKLEQGIKKPEAKNECF
jgi:hypothetical protein